jgi:hypothetical protein
MIESNSMNIKHRIKLIFIKTSELPREPSLLCIVKWGGELTAGGRVQAEELGRIFRCMYPGGQGISCNRPLTL